MPSYTDTLYGNNPISSYTSQLQAPSYQPQSAAPSQGAPPGAPQGANPYVQAGGMALDVIGTGFDIYGKYQAREDAKKQHEEAMRIYNEQLRLQEEDRQREIARQQRQENYFGGEYSQGLEDRFSGSYGGYRQPGAV